MSIVIANNESTYLKTAAHYFLESAVSAIEKDGHFAVAVSGGSTPQKLFSLLADDYYRTRIPWDKTYLFWVDERCVPPHHADSNYGMTKERLLSRVPLPDSHVFRMAGEMVPPQAAAKAYEQAMRNFFKVSEGFPTLDLVFLGMGEDGHTASLFPGTEALREHQHWVTANHVTQLSSSRLTLTFPVINNARRIVFLCTGENKAGLVRDIFRDDISDRRYPAQLIRPVKGELIWLLDSGSSSKLKGVAADEAKHV